ncbi:RsmB/NOP family class I SAM-dependent RNA methyltransferase [Primorskyibacter sp. S187A]|uniref:RsmB/NOP family class I SAM-dependent RNA methyltransferase n=1 Tax=Primorskyibacter sp. S187A TaxID=3415130 RepID=UPI003C7E8E5D
MADKRTLTARGAALWLLSQVLREGRLLSEVQGAPRLANLPAAERARAGRLATDTLRHLERTNRVLKPFLRKPPPPPVLEILQLSTCELCLGGDAHGVVNEAVSLTRATKRHSALSGLVNAVLRKVAAEGPAKWAELRAPHLPKWLRRPLADAWGADSVAAMERVFAERPPLDLTLKSSDANQPDGIVLPTGTLRLTDPGQVSALPGFANGAWWVQDAAAALPVRGLGDVTGLNVLDMCAAPGGKTMQLAARGAKVTALDASESRLARVHENLERTGLKADIVCADALSYDQTGFDAILLDAPCSATGTIRRHPDLPHAKTGEEIGALIEMQARMLDHALSLLKPGGKLVFCTCSLLPDEGECQIDDALARHDVLRVVREAFDIHGVDPAWRSSEGGLRLRPDLWAEHGGMDGFYMACLQTSA